MKIQRFVDISLSAIILSALSGCTTIKKRTYIIGSLWQSRHIEKSVVQGGDVYSPAGPRVDSKAIGGATVELVRTDGTRLDSTTSGSDGRFWVGHRECADRLIVTADNVLQFSWKLPSYSRNAETEHFAIILKPDILETSTPRNTGTNLKP